MTRDTGIPKVMTWRWAPCAALVLGSISFVGFALLVIPDRIGAAAHEGGSALRIGGHYAAGQLSPQAASDWSGEPPSSGTSTHIDSAVPRAATRVATHGSEVFPKRGFTPPLERAEPPPPPAPPPPEAAPPAAAAPPQPEPAPAPPAPAPEAPTPQPAQPDLPPPGSGPAPGPVTPQND